MFNVKRALIIAPHADDEVFGMAGTIKKMTDNGIEVLVVVVCCGSDYTFEHVNASIDRDVRKSEMQSVASLLGCKAVMLDFVEESRMDTVPIRSIVMEIERIQDDFKADSWFVAGQSFHQDHRVVYNAAMAASRVSRATAPLSVFLYETPMYAMNTPQWSISPNVYVDISPYVDAKISAVLLYKSQIRTNGPLSPDRIIDWSKACGSECGVVAAERFQLLRMILL
jgi:LmbE family N-acetylglucosaminyl deacetylase